MLPATCVTDGNLDLKIRKKIITKPRWFIHVEDEHLAEVKHGIDLFWTIVFHISCAGALSFVHRQTNIFQMHWNFYFEPLWKQQRPLPDLSKSDYDRGVFNFKKKKKRDMF